jgi:predicted transcriptional regulator
MVLWYYGGGGKMSDKSQVKVYLPEELHELLNADRRSNSEAVETALWKEFGGERKSVIRVRKENKEDELKAAKQTLKDDRANVRQLKEEIEELETRLERVNTKEEERLNEARNVLADVPKDAENPAVKNWADKLGMTPTELLEEISDE